ncbi:MAG TPA: molybdopterin-dependent oxidoreductase, partial [Rhodanobacteraceae bacterium]
MSISYEELQLATRNHGMPLEALQYPVTPVGLHYLLIHYDIPVIAPEDWRLRIDGCVDHPIELSLPDLRAMPSTTRALTMECAGNGRALLEPRPLSQPWMLEAVGTGEWTGIELRHVLDIAGVRRDAIEVLFTGADRGIEGGVEQSYQRSVPVDVAVADRALLAYDLNGGALPPQHGFPLRLVMPGWYGMTNVKWLTGITLIDEPFSGYQHSHAYRLREHEDDEGTPLSRMATRALMVPPGMPDFYTRVRTVTEGLCTLYGRAWSGSAAISSVSVSVDGGATWDDAVLDEEPSHAGTWIGWRYEWDARPGETEVCCR